MIASFPVWSTTTSSFESAVALRMLLVGVMTSAMTSLMTQSLSLNHRVPYFVEEETEPGTLIGSIPESMKFHFRYAPEVFRTLRYRFLTPAPGFIAIEETSGRIVTRGRVDREALCPGEPVCRISHDVAIQPVQFFQIIKIAIEIIDINDNRPEFNPHHVTHEMIESSSLGTTVVMPTARDADTLNNSVQTYRILAADPEDEKMEVRIQTKLDGSKEVRLVLVRALDRETRDRHTFKVIALDGGTPPMNGSIEVSIVVLDANDNTPIFEQSSYEARVPENVRLLTTVTRVVAYDNDVGLNGEVTYGFGASTRKTYGEIFAVNNRSGEIYVIGVVDHEFNPVCHLIVTAVDLGPDALQSEATVLIRIDDVNDNAPHVIVNTLYDSDTDVAQVMETVDVGSFVGHVIGRDPDRGQNGRFNCSVDGGERHFRLRRIDSEEYHIVTAATLDREQIARFRVTLICQDGGQRSLVSTKTLVVDVLDVNDNPPVFPVAVYLAKIPENNLVGANVLQVNAVDNDAGENANVTYHLTGNGSGFFWVDPNTGVVSANVRFDHEKVKELRFTAHAYDAGMPRLEGSVLVTVRILDSNDESPEFTDKSYSFFVVENRSPGTEVGTVTATDADSPPFDKFLYHLQSTSSSEGSMTPEAFSVDPTSGLIFTTTELDRERQPLHRFLAVARDNTTQYHHLSGTATVTVHVLDVNDNEPVFLFPTNRNGTVVLGEPVRRGQTVSTVICRDPDLGQYSDIHFAITRGNSHGLFRIDPKTGVITTTDEIHTLSAANNRSFTLTLMASDRGEVPQRSFATLNLIVTRVDARPRRGLPFGAVTLSERNLPAVVAICVTSGVVVALLLAAILVVGCRTRTTESSEDSGSCNPDRMIQVVRAEGVLMPGLTDSPGSKSNAMLITSSYSSSSSPYPPIGVTVNGVRGGTGAPNERPNGTKAIQILLQSNGKTKCQTAPST